MSKDGKDAELRKGLTSVVEEYIDSMDLDSKDLERIVTIANDIYSSIKKSGNEKDVESLALTMFIIASEEKKKANKDPYEFVGYA